MHKLYYYLPVCSLKKQFYANQSKLSLLFYLLLNWYNFAHHLPFTERKIKISLQICINFGKSVEKNRTLYLKIAYVVSTLKLIPILIKCRVKGRPLFCIKYNFSVTIKYTKFRSEWTKSRKTKAKKKDFLEFFCYSL